MAKVMVMVLLTLMPISSAASRSSETARIALPMRVRLMNSVSPTMMAAVTPSVSRVMPSTVTPPSVREGRSNSAGVDFCSGPKIRSARFWSR